MTFKSPIWFPLAAGLSALNLVAVGFAAASAEPWHAAAHVALALGFGEWARRLNRGRGTLDRQDRLDEIEAEVGSLQRELSETQERLDFAERMLAQAAESRRVDQAR